MFVSVHIVSADTESGGLKEDQTKGGWHAAVNDCFVGMIQWHNSVLRQMVLIIFI